MASMINTAYMAENENRYKNKTVSVPEKTDAHFSDRMAEKLCTSSRDMTLSEYKIYFYDKVNALYLHPSQKNVFWCIDITDAAYERMQADPLYEQKVLDYLEKNRAVNCGCHPPQFTLVHIDDTWEKSYGYSMGVQHNNCYHKQMEAKRRAAEEYAKKMRRKKLLREYLKKKAEAKRLQDILLSHELEKKRLEHIRLEKSWDRKRQMSQAARAYEASLAMLSSTR